jgi:hypothetical protein
LKRFVSWSKGWKCLWAKSKRSQDVRQGKSEIANIALTNTNFQMILYPIASAARLHAGRRESIFG